MFSVLTSGLLFAGNSYATDELIAASEKQLIAQSHVCNDESEIRRLAENEHLQEMARALVEFKATRYCFILEPAASITVVEQQPLYVKFQYKSQLLYTFVKYLAP